MATILPFTPTTNVFYDETTRLLGDAYDAACAELGQLTPEAREIIAMRIMAAAETGERDPTRLRNAALDGLGIRKASYTASVGSLILS